MTTMTAMNTPAKKESTHMRNSVVQLNCCRGKRQVSKPFTHALAHFWVSTEGSSKRLFCFHSNPQSGLANAPMSGRHSYTDGIAVATPMPVAFRSDYVNEQHKPTSAFSPRYGRSINRIRRSACSSPNGWLKTPKPHRSGVLGSLYACNLE